MSAYMIFVLLLSIAYFIYYGIIIGKDLYGKKSPANSEEEEFDLTSAEEEMTVQVSETDDGFHVGNAPTEEKLPAPDEPAGPITAGEQAQEPTQNATEEKAERLRNQMDEADVECEGGLNEFELAELLQKRDKQGVLFIAEPVGTSSHTPSPEIRI